MLGKIQTSLRVRRRRLRRILAVEIITGPFENWSCAGGSITGICSSGRLILLCCLHLQIPLDILATPMRGFFGGGRSLSASFASRRSSFLSASFVSGLFFLGATSAVAHTAVCLLWVYFRAMRVSVYPATADCLRIGTRPRVVYFRLL